MFTLLKLIYSHLIFFLFGPRIEVHEFDASAIDSRFPSQQWDKYLQRIRNEPYGAAALALWKNVSQYNVDIPSAGPYEDEDIIQFYWSQDEHHIDVDIFHDGSFEWFYRNRNTNETDSGEQRDVGGLLSQRLLDKLGLIRKRDRQ